jgi:hypothetical protein
VGIGRAGSLVPPDVLDALHDGLLGLLGGEEVDVALHVGRLEGGPRGEDLFVELGLDVLEGGVVGAAEAVGGGDAGRQGVLVEAVDPPRPEGLLAADAAGVEDGLADGPGRESLGEKVQVGGREGDPDIELGGADLGLGVGNPVVAGQGDGGAAGDGDPVDGGDDGDRSLEDRFDDLLEAAEERPEAVLVEGGDLLEVQVRREGLASAGEDHRLARLQGLLEAVAEGPP